MSQKPKIIAIVGPTASGKTSLSIAIAKKFNGEVISADSRQVYRGLDIGTGKITKEKMAGVPHHLIDVVDPLDKYTGADFEQAATTAILDIQNRHRLPLIAGGTYFYIQLLRGNIQSAPVPPDETFRDSLRPFSNATLLEKIYVADPIRAAKIDPHNRRRLIRSLEIINQLGSVPAPKNTESPYEWLIISINVPKETLLKNFAKRLNGWLDAGFQTEVENLLNQGITRERFQEFGFEYTLMLDYIDGEISLTEFKEKFIQKNWQYAKRQMTWLKRDNEIEWFEPDKREAIMQRVTDFLD